MVVLTEEERMTRDEIYKNEEVVYNRLGINLDKHWLLKNVLSKVQRQVGGNCWAFGCSGLIESAYLVSKLEKEEELPLLCLSIQQATDCLQLEYPLDPPPPCCDKGIPAGLIYEGLMYASVEGIVSADYYEQDIQGIGECRCPNIRDVSRYFPYGCRKININNWDEVTKAIDAHPIIGGVLFDRKLSLEFHSKDDISVFMGSDQQIIRDLKEKQYQREEKEKKNKARKSNKNPEKKKSLLFSHGVLITGYDDKVKVGKKLEKVFLIKNSQGDKFGVKGFRLVARRVIVEMWTVDGVVKVDSN